MKKAIPAILFLLLQAGIINAQEAKEPSAAAVPSVSKPTAASTSKKIDLTDLMSLMGQKAPNFRSADMNGTEFNLENLRGKIVVINLWATWCRPCIAEMPELNALTDKFKASEVVFLAAAPEDKEFLEVFLKKNPFSYHILPGALDIIKQFSPKEKPDPATGKSRRIQALPTHIVIDREGTVVKHFWGFSSQKIPELSQTIEEILDSKNPV